jgi:hypothetical protein
MGKKAKRDHTPERPLLDDDARWLLIETARQRMSERTNDTALTIDLTKALADDRLPCMVQSTTKGERNYVAATEWRGQIMLDDAPTGVRVVHHYQPNSRGYAVRPFPGRFFVSQPAFDNIWPPPAGTAPVDHDDASDAPPKIRPGTKPTGDWPTLIGRWLIEVAVEDPKRLQNVDALVVEAQNFLDDKINWSPAIPSACVRL